MRPVWIENVGFGFHELVLMRGNEIRAVVTQPGEHAFAVYHNGELQNLRGTKKDAIDLAEKLYW